MKSLIVTGGSSGIGRAIMEKIAPQFEKKLNIDVHVKKPIDVRNYMKVKAAMEEIFIPQGENYLFSNAGVAIFIDPKTKKPIDFANAPIEQLMTMVDINFKGQINVLHAFISLAIKNKAKGNIVVISSISADFSGGPLFAVYDATKAAITALAKRLVPYKNIRINVIQPGSVRTNIGGWSPDLSPCPEGLELVKRGQDKDKNKIGKELQLEQVVNITKFLFFEDHGLNGAVITVDEGLTLMGRDY